MTDHLQLLLRKSGHHLHTSAEREVVRTIKEKCCYVALNPSKEEKDSLGSNEEFRLPDGNVVQVMSLSLLRKKYSDIGRIKAWSRAFPCSRDPVQPGTSGTGGCRCPSSSC